MLESDEPGETGPHAAAEDAGSAQAEQRMRQSLERLGGRPAERGGFVAARPRRHGFVQDGQVVVEQARRRPRLEPQPVPEQPEGPRGAEQAARLERALQEARAHARASQTRLGHLELELSDAAQRARTAEETIVGLRAELAARAAQIESQAAELDRLRRHAERRAARADQVAGTAGDAEGQPEPVQWWLNVRDRSGRG